MQVAMPFIFRTERRLVRLTGRKARGLSDFLLCLREVSGASIFYHTHHVYLSHHFERPLFYNDFATWVSQSLLEQALAEKLAVVDLLEFTTIRQLRERIIETIESHLASSDGGDRQAPRGEEFHFCESQSFRMPTGITAANPREFFENLPHVTTISLFYHFFEARLRLGRATNDFSVWFADIGEDRLARRIDALNPYRMTLEQLRTKIVRMGKSNLGRRSAGRPR
jgi:hypothetical protein